MSVSEDVAARRARDAGELQDPADARRGGARRRRSAEQVAGPSPWRAAKGAGDEDRASRGELRARTRTRSGATRRTSRTARVAAPVDAEDLHDVASRARPAGDASTPIPVTAGAKAPIGQRKESRERSSSGTPAGPLTTKSLRPATVEAASRNDSVTLRFA